MGWDDPRAAAVLTALIAVADRIATTSQPAQLISEVLQEGFNAVENDPNAPAAMEDGTIPSLPSCSSCHRWQALVRLCFLGSAAHSVA